MFFVKQNMATARNNTSTTPTGKEPWLAVNLSIFFPGFGQMYAGYHLRGWLILIGNILLSILGLVLIVTSKNIIITGLIWLAAVLISYTWNLFDAYNCAKKENSPSFEALRKRKKDPWFAVFLSRIILGTGHIYIRNYVIGFLAIFFVVISYSISSNLVGFLISIALFIFSPFLIYHVYTASPINRARSRRAILTVSILSVIAPIILVILAIPTALFIRTFIAEARWIPSVAMMPTLQKYDKLIVDKVSYHFDEPQRGDIIVFSPTETILKDNPNLKDAFIKRIVGLPGEKVEVKEGKVFINDRPLEENYIKSPPQYQYGPVTVPPNSYFVLGDNRNNSYDSHFWGFVPRENIIGRASEIFFPLERAGSLK